MHRITKEHIEQLLAKNLREDGRALDAYRKPVTIEYGISPKTADGVPVSAVATQKLLLV